MVAMDYFADAAARAGLQVVVFGDRAEFDAFSEHPDIWKPIKGTRLVFKAATQVTAQVHESIRKAAAMVDLPTVILAPGTNFGARLARETDRLPLVTVHLQPISLLSAYDWPVLHLRLAWTRRLPLWLRRLFLAMPNPIDWMAHRALRSLCQAHGVKLPLRVTRHWWHSPDGNLILFPEAMGTPQPDWPENALQVGFPLEDLANEQRSLPQEVSAFLQNGSAPVVFTAGTGNRQAKWYFSVAMEACHALGLRAIFATRHLPDVPRNLTSNFLAVEYIPFSLVLPHCAALAHHGGIGTLSQALAAGIPQLIMPFAHDQPDNALRVKSLGLGDYLPRAKWTPLALCEKLHELITDDALKQRCHQMASTFSGIDPNPTISWLEEIADRTTPSSASSPSQ
jgi:rhamnosyltransferase subunit B